MNPCPLVKYCSAHHQGITHLIPVKQATKELPVRTATFLILQNNNRVLLHKRPPMGIWGGLWSFPEIAGEPLKENIHTYCRQQLKLTVTGYELLPSFRHTFSHYHLDIHPAIIPVKRLPLRIMEEGLQIWYNPREPESVGLPKPVQVIMRGL